MEQKIELTQEQKDNQAKIKAVKQVIKAMVAHQKYLNSILRLPHTFETPMVQSAKMKNRFMLKNYYIAYAIMRGKNLQAVLTLSEKDCLEGKGIETKYNQFTVNKILEGNGWKTQTIYPNTNG